MFEWLSRYSKILVTGPQRSGTRIATAMIASDLGYTFYQEQAVGIANLDRMRQLFREEDRFVLQCPSLCRYAHEVSSPDTAIVLMRRAVADIIASENRIKWGGHRRIELARYGLGTGIISEAKYHFWEEYQRHLIEHAFEIEYESLVAHPMWIPKEERSNFGRHQYHHTVLPSTRKR